uniref:DNA topoisomerase (ATP-hydrolyzing) n=1 Tax=Tanacetum cinerariifolium TaxID=118510 RepID=A0A6L2NXB5_TANCI|nr:DNA topoisomerase 2 [Tanacetum cinerariifolium]
MLDFIPPTVEASTKDNTIEKLALYSMADYEAWKKDLGDKATEYEIKYRKGLVSSENKEVKEYFANLDNCTKKFVWADDEDGDAIELAFDNDKLIISPSHRTKKEEEKWDEELERENKQKQK